jgi:metal-dependent amidase/aminoacylase/carboxypeptidase family protein
VGDPKQDHYYPLHNAKFQLDPEALTYAVALFAQITEDFLK